MKKKKIEKAFLPVSKDEMVERGWYYYDFLVVTADALPDAPVTVRLWQVRETRENTMVATLDARHRSCIFTNLPPETLYAVTVDGAPDVQLTVRSSLTFREAFSLMLQEL